MPTNRVMIHNYAENYDEQQKDKPFFIGAWVVVYAGPDEGMPDAYRTAVALLRAGLSEEYDSDGRLHITSNITGVGTCVVDDDNGYDHFYFSERNW